MNPMTKLKYSNTEVVSILKVAEAGRLMNGTCRKGDINLASCYNWKPRFGDLGMSKTTGRSAIAR